RNHPVRGADAVVGSGRPHRDRRYRQADLGPRAVEDPAQAWKLLAREPGDPNHIHRWVDRAEKATTRTSGMAVVGKWDGLRVPGKRTNKDRRSAESGEGRGPAKGNTSFRAAYRTQSRVQVLSAEQRVREAAWAASPPSTRGGSRMR